MLPSTKNAQSVSIHIAAERQRPATVRRVCGAIRTIAAHLRALDALIGGIPQELPGGSPSFDAALLHEPGVDRVRPGTHLVYTSMATESGRPTPNIRFKILPRRRQGGVFAN